MEKINVLQEIYDKGCVREMSGWIGVKDRLPGHYESVLIAVDTVNGYGEKTQYVTIGTYEYSPDKHWTCYTGELADRERVAAWMPLPEPPADEEEITASAEDASPGHPARRVVIGRRPRDVGEGNVYIDRNDTDAPLSELVKVARRMGATEIICEDVTEKKD